MDDVIRQVQPLGANAFPVLHEDFPAIGRHSLGAWPLIRLYPRTLRPLAIQADRSTETTLRGDKKLVVSAASAGQKAADWIRGERGQAAP
jgi:hypothetical protein